jgi:hypothetical protein
MFFLPSFTNGVLRDSPVVSNTQGERGGHWTNGAVESLGEAQHDGSCDTTGLILVRPPCVLVVNKWKMSATRRCEGEKGIN